MTIAPTAATPPSSIHTAGTPTVHKKQMDQEVFLALLVAQLRNQDPTAPMDTTEMMAQSTQLASMEQLTGLADTSRESFALQMRIAASGLVGQQVSYVDDAGEVRHGIATAVSFETEVPMVTIGEDRVALDAVSAVRADPLPTEEPPEPDDPPTKQPPTDTP